MPCNAPDDVEGLGCGLWVGCSYVWCKEGVCLGRGYSMSVCYGTWVGGVGCRVLNWGDCAGDCIVNSECFNISPRGD